MEVDLLRNYPRTRRDTSARGAEKTEEDRAIARRFGKEFFDGDRRHGYGGFNYNPKFWQPVVPAFIDHWGLSEDSSLLDVGCAKGFMLVDFLDRLPSLRVRGIDISEYAVENAHEKVKSRCSTGCATALPFQDDEFDYVVSINTIHNLEHHALIKALSEIERVSKFGSFITVDAYTNEIEKRAMLDWNLTAKTIMSVDEWVELFKDAGYTGDYFWFMP